MKYLRWSTLLVVLFCTDAAATGANKNFSDQVLPVVVDSATFQTEIYIHAMNYVYDTQPFKVTYYGGADTTAPGPLDCGQHMLGDYIGKYSLRDLCPLLPPGSQYGMLSISSVGLYGGHETPGRLQVFARVQNYQGIGFSVEGIAPESASSFTKVIGLKSGVDANGLRYQSNCFVGLFPENDQPRDGYTDATAHLMLFGPGVQADFEVPLRHNGLTRVLDVFAAAGLPDAYRENVMVQMYVDGNNTPRQYFAFCTQQENGNFSADIRLASPVVALHDIQSQVINPLGYYDAIFTLSGSEVAVFRPIGWNQDSMQCEVSEPEKMWVRVRGYYDPNSPPILGQTGRLRHVMGLHGSLGDLEVGLMPGVATANAYVTCRSGKGFPALIRVK